MVTDGLGKKVGTRGVHAFPLPSSLRHRVLHRKLQTSPLAPPAPPAPGISPQQGGKSIQNQKLQRKTEKGFCARQRSAQLWREEEPAPPAISTACLPRGGRLGNPASRSAPRGGLLGGHWCPETPELAAAGGSFLSRADIWS